VARGGRGWRAATLGVGDSYAATPFTFFFLLIFFIKIDTCRGFIGADVEFM
jgi:hypothetical protein